MLPFPAGGPNPQFRGVVVAPWPNRIPDGEYTFDGIDYRLPVNEPDRQCALHGFTPELDWTLETQAESALTLSCSIGPTPGYPFALTITASTGWTATACTPPSPQPIRGSGRHRTGCARTRDGQAYVVVRDPGGTGVGMAWDRSCAWLQLYTGDAEPPLPSRLGLAVEPMTCPPDAFNSGTDLVRLEPGDSHRAAWRVYAA